MKFSHEDILRLYGPVFFHIPDVEERSAVETASGVSHTSSRFNDGPNIIWKVKKQSVVALILEEDEFSNKQLTSSLKSMIIQAGISPAQVGFGLMSGSQVSYDLSDMPMEVGIFFGGFKEEVYSNLPPSLLLKEKDIFFTRTIRQITSDDKLQEQTIDILKRVKFLLHP